MENVKLQFQTPQDFQKFRRMKAVTILSASVAGLYIICRCALRDIASAINDLGATVTDAPKK
ncbi:hypothetical protein [Flaviaesturariibacter aridisoli]|uniref:Uncharacterized protein n=1 Tax=Flaviaesturariibacter aridisoli TaxID=2545761 RepID=A0A4R4DXE9_9BACT|nr:hypothetical protein [Flaviaesturariibacter aridisoli]TCZ67906.1 hypothetical protein E0486_14860 [Flaviaesturariibacter aridisoli]